MSKTMPRKYQLDSVSFVVQGSFATIPVVPCNWLGVSIGQTVGVAPKAPHEVTVGANVTRWISERTVNDDSAHSNPSPRIRLREKTMNYLGATPGDRLIAEREGNEIVVRLVEGLEP